MMLQHSTQNEDKMRFLLTTFTSALILFLWAADPRCHPLAQRGAARVHDEAAVLKTLSEQAVDAASTPFPSSTKLYGNSPSP